MPRWAESPGWIRLVQLPSCINAISPAAMNWVFRIFGVYEFYRRQAEANEELKA